MKKPNLRVSFLTVLLTVAIGWLQFPLEINIGLIANANAAINQSNIIIKQAGETFPAAFSVDGNLLAAIESNGIITVRDVASGQVLWEQIDEANQGVSDLTFSANGKLLASSGRNGVSLWNAVSGKALGSLGAQNNLSEITGIAFSPTGNQLAGKNAENILYLWNLKSGTAKLIQPGLAKKLGKVAFSLDEKFIYGSCEENNTSRIKIWNANNGKSHAELISSATITGSSYSPDGLVLATGSQDGLVSVWDPNTGKRLHILDMEDPVTAVAFSADSQYLIGASKGVIPKIQLWSSKTGELLSTQPTEEKTAITSIISNSNSENNLFAVIGEDHRISILGVPSGEIKQVLSGQTDVIVKTSFNEEKSLIAAVGNDGQLTVWDLLTGVQKQNTFLIVQANQSPTGTQAAQVASNILGVGQQANAANNTVKTNNTNSGIAAKAATTGSINSNAVKQAVKIKRQPRNWKGINAIAVSDNGLEIGVASDDGTIRILKKNGNERWQVKGHHGGDIRAIAFRNNSKQWVSAGKDTEIKVWNNATGANVKTYLGLEHPPRTLAVSPDGKYIATAGEETRVFLFDARAEKLVSILSGHSDFVNGLAFSPESNILASAGVEGRIILWDVLTGKRLNTLLGHSDEVNAVAFSPDGGLLASASQDSTVILWNAVTGQKIKTLAGHQGGVRSVAFSPDGRTLVSAGVDTKLLVWNPATAQLSKQIQGSTGTINLLAFNPNGDLHVADENSEVSEIKIDTGAKLQSIKVSRDVANTSNAAISESTLAFGIEARKVVNESGQVFAQKDKKTGEKEPSFVAAMANRLIDFLIPAANAALPQDQGPGGPILVITSGDKTIGEYYAEILRAEGLNEFAVVDNISTVNATTLAAYDVVILAQMTLNASQVTMFQDWVTAGGNLIAMRPDKQLANLLGLTDANSTLANAYLLVNTSASPGNGIVGQTMQFHGVADRYTLNGATGIATLYSDAGTATSNPAVTVRNVGATGGQAAAFAYDLATSIVYTHQGNPAWATQERDGFSPIRSDDKFYGNAAGDPQADWIDLSKVAIPQADEQQRLLANLILEINRDKKPLPRFWYFPYDKKAAVIMTGDDHANNGTEGRFNSFIASSPAGCSAQNWECIRGTSYIWSGISTTALTPQEAAAFNAAGFEVGLHVNTNCADYTPAQLEAFYTDQINIFTSKYSNIPAPTTQRHHCIAWSDWATGAKVQLNHGIRFDTSYYFWPPSWVQNTPGLFSGTGMPMRFVDLDGSMIDVYLAASQMTDESGQTYPFTIDTLLDRAIGPEGYYGAYTINAHTDVDIIPESTTTVASALVRNVPVITSKQMLDWLDYRNDSSFGALSWSGDTLNFTVTQGEGAAKVPVNGLQALLPLQSSAGILSNLMLAGNPVSYVVKTIKGIEYAAFTAAAGNYAATYTADTTPPSVTASTPVANATDVNPGTAVTATFNEAIDTNTINSSTFELRNPGNNIVAATVSYNQSTRTATLQPSSLLSANTVYTATIKGGASDPRVKDLSGNALAANFTWTFTTGAQPCSASTCSAWSPSTVPGTPSVNDPGSVELGVKFKSDLDGAVTGIRFYQVSTNTNFQATLWNLSGQQLATGSVTSSAAGWQQVNFASPVSITRDTVYVASYHAPTGNYAATNSPQFATAGVDNPPIHLLQDGVNGGNGVYAYSASSTYPNQTYQGSNYWVDVVFTTNVAPDITPPTVTGQTPAANATGIATNTSVTVTFNETMDPATINTNSIELRGPAPTNTLIASTVSYNAGARTATLTPTSALSLSTQYTVTVKGGGTDPRVKDAAGNALAANFSWSFTTTNTVATGCSGATESIWPSNPTPAVLSDPDTASVELGVKFRASTDGYICGIRFYKGASNTGTHVGKLWNSAGTLLASATFQNETASGWQTVNFSSPVQITANTQYVASYLAPVGRYSVNDNYFASGITSGSLYAFSNAESGGNGVYQYGTGSFPSSTFGASNYWVDVIFTTSIGPDTTPPTVQSTQPANNSTGFIPTNPVKAIFNEAMDVGSISGSTVELRGPGSALVAATISYNATERSAVITPNTTLANNTAYTAKVVGGTNGVKDAAGNALASDYTWTFTTGVDPCSTGGNPIICENSKTGNPSTEWDISGIGSTSIQGFATDISVNKGQTVRFKIDTPATDYRLDIYRMGYYNGNGARLIATVQPSATLPQSQPACLNNAATGLIDCGNWAESASWAVPANATSGIYFAKAVREDGANAGLASHLFFIVRDDASTSDILFQTADTTWQAYNNYGGNSLYTGSPAGRAYKVSYNRPFYTRNVDNGQDWVFNAEYPMVRWLEANGYNVSYFTGVDSDRFGNLIRNHKVFLSVGHDEYWSGQQRTNVESARDASTNPVNLVFLSGNEVYWKTRWENNITNASGTLGTDAYRTLVCYKETHAGAKIDPLPNVWTGTWRDPRFSPPADGGFPENELTGTLFMVNDGATTYIEVPEEDGKMRFWRNTSIANLTGGASAQLPNGTLGYEWDVDRPEPGNVNFEFYASRPGGAIKLSTRTVTGAPVLTDYGSNFGSGTANHSLMQYRAGSGALVFGAGTVQWSWGLDNVHDRAGTPTSPDMQQATVNLLADMGVQPGNLQAGLLAATASTDNVLPSSVITSPASGAAIAPNTTVNVVGTAADTGGRVAGVEVSVNGGAWHPATGRGNWTYSFTAPSANGTLTIRSRAIDDSLNMENPGTGITLNVGTGADTTPPSTPANFTAIVASGTQVNLNWDDSTDNVAVTRYQVERCQGAACTNFAVIGTPTLSAYNDLGLTEGVTYRYRVSAGDAANNFSGYSNIVTVTPDVTPPNAPSSLSASTISSSQINLSWVAPTDNSGVIAGYRVERCQGSGCANFAQIAAPTGTSYSDTGLTGNTLYQYRVRAADPAGNLGAYSAPASATTTAAPTAPTAVNDLFLFRSAITRTADASGPLGQGVLANDTDSLNLPLTAQLVGTLPTGVTLAANGVVTVNRTTNTTLRYRANNGTLLSQPTTGATVTLRLDSAPTTVADNCTYNRAGNGSITLGTACVMTGTPRVFSMNLITNDTDANATTNIPTDGIGDAVTGAIITSTGTGVEVAANPVCGQSAIVKAASRASVVNNCNGTLTVTVAAAAPASPISISYRALDDLGAQSSIRTDTVTVQ